MAAARTSSERGLAPGPGLPPPRSGGGSGRGSVSTLRAAVTRGLVVGTAAAVLSPIDVGSLSARYGDGSTVATVLGAVLGGLVLGGGVALAALTELRLRADRERASTIASLAAAAATWLILFVGVAAAAAQIVYFVAVAATGSTASALTVLSRFVNDCVAERGPAIRLCATAPIPLAIVTFTHSRFQRPWADLLFVVIGVFGTVIVFAEGSAVVPFIGSILWMPPAPPPLEITDGALARTCLLGLLLPLLLLASERLSRRGTRGSELGP